MLTAPAGFFTSQPSFKNQIKLLESKENVEGSQMRTLPGWHNHQLDRCSTWFCCTKQSCEVTKKFSANWCCLIFYLRDGALSSCSEFPPRNNPKKSENWHRQKAKLHIFKHRHYEPMYEQREFHSSGAKKSQEWLFGVEKLSCNHFIIWRDLWNDSPATVGPKPHPGAGSKCKGNT